jgi:hypothetical protein
MSRHVFYKKEGKERARKGEREKGRKKTKGKVYAKEGEGGYQGGVDQGFVRTGFLERRKEGRTTKEGKKEDEGRKEERRKKGGSKEDEGRKKGRKEDEGRQEER